MDENSATRTHTHTQQGETRILTENAPKVFLMTSISVLNFNEQCEHAPLVLTCMSLQIYTTNFLEVGASCFKQYLKIKFGGLQGQYKRN